MARLALVAAATLVFLLSTNPTKLPAMMLVIPFVGIFITLYLVLLEVVRFLGVDEESGAIVRFERPRLLAAAGASFPVLLLVLQSIVELTMWDVLIALGILLLAYLYISLSAVSLRGRK